jgi:uncharacterized circularly permuted ATP-grasp superfamily protein
MQLKLVNRSRHINSFLAQIYCKQRFAKRMPCLPRIRTIITQHETAIINVHALTAPMALHALAVGGNVL